MNQEMNADLKKALEVYPSFKKMMGGKVKIRTYMHQLFSSLVAEYIENLEDDDYPEDDCTHSDELDCLRDIQCGVNELTADMGFGPQEYLRIAYLCSAAYLKRMGWEDEFKQLLSKEDTELQSSAE